MSIDEYFRSREYLTLDIEYDVVRDSFKLSGDVRDGARADLIEWHLRNQMGKGADERVANKRDVYHIKLKWFPEDDTIAVKSDTGNKGLTDGILYCLISRL